MELHRGFLESEWCDNIINTFEQDFYPDPRGDWNAFTLNKESSLYEQLFSKFLPLVGYNFDINWVNVTVYNEGKGLRNHKDEASTLTIVCNLNDNYEGGRFIVNKSSYLSLGKGDCVVFNGSKVYHGVEPVTKGTRYSFNLWTVPKNEGLL